MQRTRDHSFMAWIGLVSLLCTPLLALALPLQAFDVVNARARNAVCNDGTTYVYHRRAGAGSGVNKWMIYTEGGGACGTVASCQERQRTDPEKMTADRSPTLNRGGILDDSQTRNPEFYNWNAVFMSYCSSDDHAGDRAASAETGGFHFRGYRTVRAAIEDLLRPNMQAPSLSEAEFVVFAGGSAGGAGQLTHLDWVADQVRAQRPNAVVRGFTDSFFHPPVYNFSTDQSVPLPQEPGDPLGGSQSFNFWNAQVPPECRARYPNTPFVCLGGTLMYENLRTPDFLHEDQLDEERLRRLEVVAGNFNPPISCNAYPADRRGWLSDYTEIVRSAATQPRFGGTFSGAAGFHTAATNTERYDVYRVDGQTLRQTFVNWLYDQPGLKIVIEPADCEINPTGVWSDLTQPGQGLIVEQFPGRQLLAAWFTFDPTGQQAWFLGTGSYSTTSTGTSSATLTNVRPVGTFFAPNFIPTAVMQPAFGTMTLSFSNCRSARIDYDLPQGFGRGGSSLTRTTQPTDIECDGVQSQATRGSMPAATGNWYDPAQNGQGLAVESLGGNQVLVSWFTYAPSPAGGQAWFYGIGTAQGESVQVQMLKVAGGRFIPNTNPAMVTLPVLGSATFSLTSCSSGRIDYDLGQGFGRGSQSMTRLTKPMGVVCLP